ncbi:MAG: ABC-2 transporter permease [Actinomycetaceae bacterium]|nr:ABC-2 transporter permease [Actinomycetaceae bacterium]
MSKTSSTERAQPDGLRAMLHLDLITMRAQLWVAALIATFFIVYAGLTRNPSIALPPITVLTMLSAPTVFSIDEKDRLHSLYDSLPISRRTVINARYLEIIGATLFLSVSTALILLLSGELTAWWTPLIIALLVFLACLWFGIQTPAILKFGSQKAIFVYLVIFIFLGTLPITLSRYVRLPDKFLDDAPAFLYRYSTAISASLLVVALVILGASWALSQRIYAKQDH